VIASSLELPLRRCKDEVMTSISGGASGESESYLERREAFIRHVAVSGRLQLLLAAFAGVCANQNVLGRNTRLRLQLPLSCAPLADMGRSFALMR
jgi:hypothetical protein